MFLVTLIFLLELSVNARDFDDDFLSDVADFLLDPTPDQDMSEVATVNIDPTPVLLIVPRQEGRECNSEPALLS